MLTKKELEVLRLRKKGLKQAEIAEILKVSQPAVSDFEKNAMKKISEAEEIIRLAKRLGANRE